MVEKRKSKKPRAAGPLRRLEKGEGDPEQTAALIDAVTDPWKTLTAAAASCGLDKRLAEAVVNRLRREQLPFTEELKAVKNDELLALIEDRIWLALQYLTPQKFAESDARSIAVTFGILTEKRQLLKGEPTGILEVNDRQMLSKILEKFAAEADRRQMTVDITPGSYREVSEDVQATVGEATGKDGERRVGRTYRATKKERRPLL